MKLRTWYTFVTLLAIGFVVVLINSCNPVGGQDPCAPTGCEVPQPRSKNTAPLHITSM